MDNFFVEMFLGYFFKNCGNWFNIGRVVNCVDMFSIGKKYFIKILEFLLLF